MNRISTSFHQSFSISLPAVSKVLKLSSGIDTQDIFTGLSENTDLGNNYIKSMPRYAVGAGLLKDRSYKQTALGKKVAEQDPHLSRRETLWLMHYHLSAPLGPGPLFWHFLVTNFLAPGATLETEVLNDTLNSFLETNIGQRLAPRTVRTLITIFSGSYCKIDGFGRLGILGEQGGQLMVLEPESPPTYAVGFALADYWESVWGNCGAIDLEEIYRPGGLATILFVNRYKMNKCLRDLQTAGLLELWQVATPYQLVKHWSSKEDFLERLYA